MTATGDEIVTLSQVSESINLESNNITNIIGNEAVTLYQLKNVIDNKIPSIESCKYAISAKSWPYSVYFIDKTLTPRYISISTSDPVIIEPIVGSVVHTSSLGSSNGRQCFDPPPGSTSWLYDDDKRYTFFAGLESKPEVEEIS